MIDIEDWPSHGIVAFIVLYILIFIIAEIVGWMLLGNFFNPFNLQLGIARGTIGLPIILALIHLLFGENYG